MPIEQRLESLGVVLPPAAAPVANYVPAVVSGNLIIVSGQLPFNLDGRLSPAHIGKVGKTVSQEEAKLAAHLCGLNILAQVQRELGTLDRVVRVLRLGGFINAIPEFTALPAIMNGASDLMVAAFADAGRHARTTIGVPTLPLDACAEVEAMFEIRT
jgi:enamine deaminase RidA (YjgF/YER057c/UK114 family)